MDASGRDLSVSYESSIQQALQAYRKGYYSSIRAAAANFKVSRRTLQRRLDGTVSRTMAHEYRQNLSTAEERTLYKWITHLTRTGFPISPALAIEMAETIRLQRYQLSKSACLFRPLGKNWLDKFRVRYSDIKGVWSRKLERARHAAINSSIVEEWFQAVTSLIVEHQYQPKRIYNMDESGFAIGESQSSRSLVNIREELSWEVIQGRQEWVTAIECINAIGETIPPLVIFKAQYTNTSWIPADAPPNWRFSTSNKGWTTDSHGFEWIQTVFEPLTRPADPSERRLLIMDGHSSHMTAKFIALCMDSNIDMLILPPHTSHELQPLDISLFQPLKKALAIETDRLTALADSRIPRAEWVEAYIRARERAFILSNIQAGWKASGLWPLSPIEVLNRVRQQPSATTTTHSSTNASIPSAGLDMCLLQSSPPDGTELREANIALRSELQKKGPLPTPAKRYTERMTYALETTQSELAIARKELADTKALLRKRQERKKGKRIALKGRFVFSTQEVLDIARVAEAETAKKKSSQKRKTKKKEPKPEDSVDDDSEATMTDSDSDCITVAAVRSS